MLDQLTMRKKAEKKVRGIEHDFDLLPPDEMRRMFHELQVHKIELEMQNDELRRVQEELDNARERYYDLYNLAPIGYFIVSHKGQILEANLAAANLLGETRSELVKKPFSFFIYPLDQDIQHVNMLKLLNTGLPQSYELRMLKKNKGLFWAQVESALRFDFSIELKKGSAVSVPEFRLTITDISSRKKAEEALMKSNLELEDFAGIAAHDLTEPLRKIISFSSRLNRENISDQDLDYLKRMQLSAERMWSLINDLVKYSKTASGDYPFKIINLDRPASDAVSDLSALLDETGGRIEIEKLPEISANETQMRQLFQNLIGNALKYRSERKALVKIFSRPSPMERHIDVYVEDNGIGFDEKHLDKIFKPFQRLHGRSSQCMGTGMGLAICRKIVERHGGSITAKSSPGNGATFIVTLPTGHDAN
jgi:two-component system, chemotaxis family, sensor kinase Cph1